MSGVGTRSKRPHRAIKAEQTTEIPKQRKIDESSAKIKTEVKSEPGENAKAKSPGKGEKSFKPVSPPENWFDMLENIRKMREKRDAPVDTMGCQKCYEDRSTEEEKRFQILISLLMSSQTKDEVNAAAMMRLNEKFEVLSASKAAQANEKELADLIHPVGFKNTKAKNIIKVGKICDEQYGGDIPDTIEKLVALPGIGPKMGYLALQCAFGKNDGIGVDVHMHRILQRLKWTKKAEKSGRDPDAAGKLAPGEAVARN